MNLECLALTLMLAQVAPVDPEAARDDHSLNERRTAFNALTEHALGTASRAVRFDWRRTTIGFGVSSSLLLELNNFSSARVGGFARFPAGSFMFEVAVTRVVTWSSWSSELLALTPYRQVGRPSRVELDINVGYPLFEGVATGRARFLPPTEFVISLTAGLRYLYYPGSLSHLTAGQVAVFLFNPVISDAEALNLEEALVPSMQLDRARYQLLVGLTTDVYFQPGLFVTPRVMLGLPLITGGGRLGISLWWELSLLAGYAL